MYYLNLWGQSVYTHSACPGGYISTTGMLVMLSWWTTSVTPQQEVKGEASNVYQWLLLGLLEYQLHLAAKNVILMRLKTFFQVTGNRDFA